MFPLSKPKLLYLFCCSGGGARGYDDAGFEVTGVDINPQPNFPFEFHRADAFKVLSTWDLSRFDAIHASPPCQGFSQLSVARGDGTHLKYPNLIPQTRAALIAAGKPYVIENVERRAPMAEDSILMCGTQLGGQYMWHRKFECSFPVEQLKCNHDPATTYSSPYTMPNYNRIKRDFGPTPNPEIRFFLLRGVDWTRKLKEGRNALPPAYTEYIGGFLAEALALPEAA